MTTTKKLQLTARESQLRNLLIDVAASVDRSGGAPEPLVLRWAGGWVRDKLLGAGSQDIDVAINAMTGLTFGERMREYCDVPENAAKHSIGPDDIGNLHKIARNPDKSKNLETTTVKVFGLDLDLVNLRTETYAEDSRNPVVEFGSAQEDALRRDATVNALFYNLHTDEVEDFTGGLADMDARLIRTPLEPLQTFMDDPLRVLRLVRFASRLQFAIDPGARKVMAAPEVLESLQVKISRERVGVELEKMLKGKYPHVSMKLIDELGLYQAIYTDPTRADLPGPALSKWNIAYGLLHQLSLDKSPGSIYNVLVRTKDESYFAWALASLTPFAHAADPSGRVKGKEPLPVATTVARAGARAPNKLCDIITAAVIHQSEMRSFKDDICKDREVSAQRDVLGMAIRAWDARDTFWRVQVLYAILVDAMDNLDHIPMSDTGQDDPELISQWQSFLDHLAGLDLMTAPSLRRLVDGKMLTEALGVKPGKWMGQALDVCLAWQLRNPEAIDTAGAIDEVRRRSEKLGIRDLKNH